MTLEWITDVLQSIFANPDLRLPANRPLASNLDLRRVATDGRYISEAC